MEGEGKILVLGIQRKITLLVFLKRLKIITENKSDCYESCECLWKFIFDLRLRESYIYLSYKICDCGVLKAGSRGRNRDWEAEATQNDRKNNDRKAI